MTRLLSQGHAYTHVAPKQYSHRPKALPLTNDGYTANKKGCRLPFVDSVFIKSYDASRDPLHRSHFEDETDKDARKHHNQYKFPY